jgi:hypothetical protein
MMVLFSPPRAANAPGGKLADVTLQFDEGEGAFLRGLELHGLAVWERKDGSGIFLSLPGREYAGRDGKKKTFDFLRYTRDGDRAQLDNLKALVLEQFNEWRAGR